MGKGRGAGHHICADCAVREGATWPVGKEATHFWGQCDWCHQQAAICGKRNWAWPEERDGQKVE